MYCRALKTSTYRQTDNTIYSYSFEMDFLKNQNTAFNEKSADYDD